MLVVVLGDPPGVGPGVVVDQVGGDGQGPVGPDPVAGGVARGEVGLDRVHVAVGAAVGLGFGEAGVPGLARPALGVGPEVPVDGGRGGREHSLGPGQAGHDSGGGGQQGVGVRVVVLGGVGDPPGEVQAGEPAAVPLVGVTAGQGGQAGIGQRPRAGVTGQVGQREDVDHAGAEVERARLGGIDPAVTVEPAEPAAGQGGRAPEGDQPGGFSVPPLHRAGLAHALPPRHTALTQGGSSPEPRGISRTGRTVRRRTAAPGFSMRFK